MDAIDRHVARHPGSPVLVDVLGTADPALIRARAFELEPDAAGVFAFGASVGALFGIERRDGTRVAVKIHKLFRDERYFDDVHAVQAVLADRGFPAPRPLGRRGLVTWEEWCDTGAFRDAHEPEVRRAMAALLVRFVEMASAVGVRPARPFFPGPGGSLWPTPHNALFDFDATRLGAEWIDEIARSAKEEAQRDVGRSVVGHTDWAAKHVRFDDDLRPTVLYDWDSVDTQAETRIVGSAAAAFTYTEEVAVASKLPSPDEALAFIADYEESRGASFSADERRAVHGAAVYLAAYGARCTWAYANRVDRDYLEQFARALL